MEQAVDHIAAGHSPHCRCSSCDSYGHDKRPPLLSIENLSFYRENRVILDNVNLTVDHGDFIAITGPNGGGKTTLLRLVLGLLRPDRGRIVYFGTDSKPMAARPAIGYLPQKNAVDDHFPITVREVVASGLLHINMREADRRIRVDEALETVLLSDLASRPIGRLSGGQLQRTLLARAIVSRPSVLVLDEPLSYIDRNFEERLYSILATEAQRATILLVSHQMSRIAAMAGRHIIVDHTLEECTHHIHYRGED